MQHESDNFRLWRNNKGKKMKTDNIIAANYEDIMPLLKIDLIRDFKSRHPNAFQFDIDTFSIECDQFDFLERVVDIVDDDVIEKGTLYFNSFNYYILTENYLLFVETNDYKVLNSPNDKVFSRKYHMYAHASDRNFARSLNQTFLKSREQEAKKTEWYYDTPNGMVSTTMNIAPPGDCFDEFYPFLKNGVNDFFDRYMNSKANNLILLGPPGTGKTSFIRSLIHRHDVSSMMSYDEGILNQDRFYMSYISSNKNLLVLEDADILLLSREKDSNRMLNKILNTSDGLVDTTNKKIIFTANITDAGKIDEALTRPGRCFDVVNFRSLYRDEAEAVAKKIGVELKNSKSEYTLAEIFNGNKFEKPKMGFF